MRAIDYTNAQPLEQAPAGAYVPNEMRRQAILDALRGVELGAYDQQIVTCMVNMGDPVARAFVSLLLRLRDVSVLGMMALIERIEDQAKKARAEYPAATRRLAGNSGGPGGRTPV